MTALLLALLAAAPRPEWWAVPRLKLSAPIEYRETATEMCMSLADADNLAGTLAKAAEYPGVVDLSLAQLWAYHSAVGEQLRANGALDVQQVAATYRMESDAKWSTLQVALVVVGAGALGLVVGGALVLAQQAIR